LVDTPLRPELAAIAWENDPDDLAAWQQGRTGYPIVDAGMRQLATTGFMHNRVRMITASFLIKDLLIDWRQGERWFRRLLVDADVPQNAGNWQWVAGTGPDAAPYFRVFNPVRQSETFDPTGAYIRRYVPELAPVPDQWIHAPWTAPPFDLALAGVTLGDTYPYPMVDHAAARLQALAAYGAAKTTAS
jgi:deoxyribodipyrimidine photo-lyase